jgi:hypothetical protein
MKKKLSLDIYAADVGILEKWTEETRNEKMRKPMVMLYSLRMWPGLAGTKKKQKKTKNVNMIKRKKVNHDV